MCRHLAERGVRVEPDQILLTSSTSEAYSLIFKLFCDAGDEVLMPRPGYPLLSAIARAEQVSSHHYDLLPDAGFGIDPGELERNASERTRVVCFVSPNNPTGTWADPASVRSVGQGGRVALVDEVFALYCDAVDFGAEAETDAAPPTGLVLRLGGLSKACGLPHLKLAWTAFTGPHALVQEAIGRMATLADTFLSVGSPVQWALPELLAAGRQTRAAIWERAQRNGHWLWEQRGHGWSLLTRPRARAGWYACIRLPNTHTDEDICVELLRRGVLVQPGYFYDFPEDQTWLVVSLLTPEPSFQAGCAAIREFAEERWGAPTRPDVPSSR